MLTWQLASTTSGNPHKVSTPANDGKPVKEFCKLELDTELEPPLRTSLFIVNRCHHRTGESLRQDCSNSYGDLGRPSVTPLQDVPTQRKAFLYFLPLPSSFSSPKAFRDLQDKFECTHHRIRDQGLVQRCYAGTSPSLRIAVCRSSCNKQS